MTIAASATHQGAWAAGLEDDAFSELHSKDRFDTRPAR